MSPLFVAMVSLVELDLCFLKRKMIRKLDFISQLHEFDAVHKNHGEKN